MNTINNYNNINFGQKIPTSSFLKMGSGIFDYNDAKNLCSSFDQKFPGNVGYYKKALNYVEIIENQNPYIKNILNKICLLNENNLKLKEIEQLTKEIGEEIDVVI